MMARVRGMRVMRQTTDEGSSSTHPMRAWEEGGQDDRGEEEGKRRVKGMVDE